MVQFYRFLMELIQLTDLNYLNYKTSLVNEKQTFNC